MKHRAFNVKTVNMLTLLTRQSKKKLVLDLRLTDKVFNKKKFLKYIRIGTIEVREIHVQVMKQKDRRQWGPPQDPWDEYVIKPSV